MVATLHWICSILSILKVSLQVNLSCMFGSYPLKIIGKTRNNKITKVQQSLAKTLHPRCKHNSFQFGFVSTVVKTHS